MTELMHREKQLSPDSPALLVADVGDHRPRLKEADSELAQKIVEIATRSLAVAVSRGGITPNQEWDHAVEISNLLTFECSCGQDCGMVQTYGQALVAGLRIGSIVALGYASNERAGLPSLLPKVKTIKITRAKDGSSIATIVGGD